MLILHNLPRLEVSDELLGELCIVPNEVAFSDLGGDLVHHDGGSNKAEDKYCAELCFPELPVGQYFAFEYLRPRPRRFRFKCKFHII